MVTIDCIWKESQKRAQHYKSTTLLYLVAQSFLTLCDPMDCSPPFSSIHGIFQSRILEWVAVSYSRGSSWPRDPAHLSCVSCIGWWLPYDCTTSIIKKIKNRKLKTKRISTLLEWISKSRLLFFNSNLIFIWIIVFAS